MFYLLNMLEVMKREKVLERTHEVMLEAVAAAIKALHKLPEETTQEELVEQIGMSLKEAFKKELVDHGKVESYYLDIWERIEDMKKLVEEGRSEELLEKDVYKMREYVRELIHDLAKVLKKEELEGLE